MNSRLFFALILLTQSLSALALSDYQMQCYIGGQPTICNDFDCACLSDTTSGGTSARGNYTCNQAADKINNESCSAFIYHMHCALPHNTDYFDSLQACYDFIVDLDTSTMPIDPDYNNAPLCTSPNPIAWYSTNDFCCDYDYCKSTPFIPESTDPKYPVCVDILLNFSGESTDYYNQNCTGGSGGDTGGSTGGNTGGNTGGSGANSEFPCGIPGKPPCHVYDEQVHEAVQNIILLLNDPSSIINSGSGTSLDTSLKTVINDQLTQLQTLNSAYDTSTQQISTAINAVNSSISALTAGTSSPFSQQTTQLTQQTTQLTQQTQALSDLKTVYSQGTTDVTNSIAGLSTTSTQNTTSVVNSIGSLSDVSTQNTATLRGGLDDVTNAVNESSQQSAQEAAATVAKLDEILINLVNFSSKNHDDLTKIHTQILDIDSDLDHIRQSAEDIEQDTTALVKDQKALLNLFETDGEIRQLLENKHIQISTFSCPQYTEGARLDKSSIEFDCSGDEYKCHQAEYIFKLRCANYLYQMERLELLKGSNESYECPENFRPFFLDGNPVCRFKNFPFCDDNSLASMPASCYSPIAGFKCNPEGVDTFQPMIDPINNGFVCDSKVNAIKYSAEMQYLDDISSALKPIEYQEYKCNNDYYPALEKTDNNTILPVCTYRDQSQCGNDGQSSCSITANITCLEGQPQISPSINGFICEKQFQAIAHNDMMTLLQQIAQTEQRLQEEQSDYDTVASLGDDLQEQTGNELSTHLSAVDSSNFATDTEILGITVPFSQFFGYFSQLSDIVIDVISSVFMPSCTDPIISIASFNGTNVQLFEGYCQLLTPIRTVISWYLLYITFTTSISMYSRVVQSSSLHTMSLSAS